jgi:hypothetical protein
MALAQLMGRYFRLKQELHAAYEMQPCHLGRIDRLTEELAEAERHIAASAPADEQCSELAHSGFQLFDVRQETWNGFER